jgi:hypothetical protein
VKVYIQWTKANPEDWEEYDFTPKTIEKWARLPKKAIPHPESVIDNNPGWIFAINCQGIVMKGYDHYAIEPTSDLRWGWGLKFTLWQDDPEDFPEGTRWATVWELFEPGHDDVVGQTNTRQRRTIFSEDNSGHPALTGGEYWPWKIFVPPQVEKTAHGVWVSDRLFDGHKEVVSDHHWREWI